MALNALPPEAQVSTVLRYYEEHVPTSSKSTEELTAMAKRNSGASFAKLLGRLERKYGRPVDAIRELAANGGGADEL